MSEIQQENNQGNSLAERISLMWRQFCDWVWQHPQQDDFFGAGLLRALLRIIFIVARESQDDRITLRASALTFTVVLSLVPMLALGTAVLKGLGAGDQMRQAAYTFIDQFDSFTEASSTAAADTSSPEGQQEETRPEGTEKNTTSQTDESKSQGLTSHLRRAVDQIFAYVDRTDFTTLGTIGVIGMVLAALGVLASIENSMNAIWQTTTGRAIGRKIIDYMALMILLPLSINLALASAAALQSPVLHTYIQNIFPVIWLQKFFFKTLPVVVLVITFSLLYQFLPNARVRFSAALAGGIFGGFAWFWIQILYVKLQIGVAKYNAIYGSFATLPLFLLWIHMAWIVFLLGAEVSFAFQARRQYQWKNIILTPVARMALAFDIMAAALKDFSVRKITDRNTLAQAIKQPEKAIGPIVNDLVKGGLLRRIDAKLEGYVPAGPLNELKPSEIVDIILGRDVPDVKGCDLARQALEAARTSLDRYNIYCQEMPTHRSKSNEDTRSGTS